MIVINKRVVIFLRGPLSPMAGSVATRPRSEVKWQPCHVDLSSFELCQPRVKFQVLCPLRPFVPCPSYSSFVSPI
jgi:hypothetical protein